MKAPVKPEYKPIVLSDYASTLVHTLAKMDPKGAHREDRHG